jgi:hypothetical protein
MKSINKQLLDELRQHHSPPFSPPNCEPIISSRKPAIQKMPSSMSKTPKNEQSVGMIHSLYQDLYLTDLKQDLGDLDTDLQVEKARNLELTQAITKLKKEVKDNKRTIANYRKMVMDMQKDFFGGGKQGVLSTNSGQTPV